MPNALNNYLSLKHCKLPCRPHPDGTKFENPTTYIPAEMALLPKSKIGVPVGWQTKRATRKVFINNITLLR